MRLLFLGRKGYSVAGYLERGEKGLVAGDSISMYVAFVSPSACGSGFGLFWKMYDIPDKYKASCGTDDRVGNRVGEGFLHPCPHSVQAFWNHTLASRMPFFSGNTSFALGKQSPHRGLRDRWAVSCLGVDRDRKSVV